MRKEHSFFMLKIRGDVPSIRAGDYWKTNSLVAQLVRALH